MVGLVPMVWQGQRVTMMFLLPLFLLSWVSLAFSTSIWMIQSSRAVMGFIAGALEVASYAYSTEIAHRSLRGMLVGTVDTMRQVGMLGVFTMGPSSLSWRNVAIICGCISTIPVFLALFFLPNSPRWLLTKGRSDEARTSLKYFRGAHYNIEAEMTAITCQCKNKAFLSQLQTVSDPKILRIILLLAFLMFIVQFTGNMVVISYLVPIYDFADVNIDPYTSAIVTGAMRVVGTIFSLSIVDRLGRRHTITISFLLISLSLSVLGTFFFLQYQGTNMDQVGWLPLLSLTVFTFFTCIGHPVLNLVRSELLPTSIRSTVSSLLYVIFFLGMFVATQTYPVLTEAVGVHGAIWVYASVCLILVTVSALFVPETRNATLEEISLTMPFSTCIHRNK